jgi:uncharacterized membrane protein (UPF0127 family)
MPSFLKPGLFFCWAPLCVLVLFGAGCSNDVASQAGEAPAGTDPLSRVEIEIASGDNVHRFAVEIADTGEKRQIGLMYRNEMAAEHGMLFLFDYPHRASMWMQNTYLPLDMLFIDGQGIVRSIARDTVPMTTTHIRSAGPVSAVLELNAGLSATLGLGPGDRVIHPFFSMKSEHP